MKFSIFKVYEVSIFSLLEILSADPTHIRFGLQKRTFVFTCTQFSHFICYMPGHSGVPQGRARGAHAPGATLGGGAEIDLV